MEKQIKHLKDLLQFYGISQRKAGEIWGRTRVWVNWVLNGKWHVSRERYEKMIEQLNECLRS